MRIGIIGGTDKNHARYEQVAREEGCEVEFHDGYMSSPATSALQALVWRCDVVVIVTRVNSHRAVRVARELSHKRKLAPMIVRRFGLHHLRAVARGHVRVPAPIAA